MNHIALRDLALFSQGDLGWWKSLAVRRHLHSCEACRAEVEAFRGTREHLHRAASELPAGIDWESLSFDMRANIRVGLDAGEAIRPVATPPLALDWRGAFAVAALTLVVMTGWFLSRRSAVLPAASAQFGFARVEARDNGVELKRGAATLTLTSFTPASYQVDTTGELTARSVDADTGQVTIRHVQVTLD